MEDIFYNIAKKDISNGLKNFEISSAQDYFILLEAPTNANITVRLNSVTAHEIPIKENWQFESADVNKMYISCDPIEGGFIKYGQADGNLIIRPNPTINKIDLINSFGAEIVSQLDKIINPYEFFESLSGSTNANVSTTMLNLTLDCDKVILNFTGGQKVGGLGYKYGNMVVYLDGANIASNGGVAYSSVGHGESRSSSLELENCRGKILLIAGINYDSTFSCFYHLQKYNLKA